jgi:hypothetical protein
MTYCRQAGRDLLNINWVVGQEKLDCYVDCKVKSDTHVEEFASNDALMVEVARKEDVQLNRGCNGMMKEDDMAPSEDELFGEVGVADNVAFEAFLRWNQRNQPQWAEVVYGSLSVEGSRGSGRKQTGAWCQYEFHVLVQSVRVKSAIGEGRLQQSGALEVEVDHFVFFRFSHGH